MAVGAGHAAEKGGSSIRRAMKATFTMADEIQSARMHARCVMISETQARIVDCVIVVASTPGSFSSWSLLTQWATAVSSHRHFHQSFCRLPLRDSMMIHWQTPVAAPTHTLTTSR